MLHWECKADDMESNVIANENETENVAIVTSSDAFAISSAEPLNVILNASDEITTGSHCDCC